MWLCEAEKPQKVALARNKRQIVKRAEAAVFVAKSDPFR